MDHSAYCLRPEFTQSLATRLLAGQSINLISPHGQGRRRTLQDLRHTLGQSLVIYQISMRDYHADIKGFYNELSIQMSHPCLEDDDLAGLFDAIEQSGQQALLILHNFDEIRNRMALAGGYNQAFMQALNSVSHRDNIALLCVGESEYGDYLLQADGTAVSDSKLDADLLGLPALRHDQLLCELQRRALPLSATELNELTGWLLGRHAPYSILDEKNIDWFKQRGWKP